MQTILFYESPDSIFYAFDALRKLSQEILVLQIHIIRMLLLFFIDTNMHKQIMKNELAPDDIHKYGSQWSLETLQVP